MREFFKDNPHLKVRIIITILAIIPMLYLATLGMLRGRYLVTAIGGASTAIFVATDVIMIGRRYKQYRRSKTFDATLDAMSKYLDGLIDKFKDNTEKENEIMEEYSGLKVPEMGTEELKEFWREVKNNRGYACRKNSSFCGTLDCAECVWSYENSVERYDYLKSIFEKEEAEETMEENKTIEEFLRPGVLFKTESGHWYINIRGNFAFNITSAVGGYIRIGSATSIKPEVIVEAYDTDATIAGAVIGMDKNQPLFVCNIETIINGRDFPWHIKTWKRPDPIKEMTMSELEKHFGCKVKIVKES